MRVDLVCLVHFFSLEKYPPVMNFISTLNKQCSINLMVFSTRGTENWFKANNTRIIRSLGYEGAAFKRYSAYIVFNVGVFLRLFFYQPKKIIVYETISVFPVWLYSKIIGSIDIYVHFHEFISDSEVASSSLYVKLLHKLQRSLLVKAKWVSHTNKDRIALFSEQYPEIDTKILKIVPNYPMKNWNVEKRESSDLSTQKKLVYVGAVDTETMYLSHFCEWLKKNKKGYTLDIITNNMTKSAKEYLECLNLTNIKILDSAHYYYLPKLLNKYDIGIVLYNGHIPNYIFNLPNKVTEYLHIGLDVWYPKSLETTTNWAKELNIINSAFNLVSDFNAINASDFNKSEINAEIALEKMINKLIDIKSTYI